MRSRMPKVLHRIGGRPLVGHVLDTARDLGPARVVVVVRHERDLVADAVLGIAPEIAVVDQDEIPGTGRAVELGLGALDGFDGDVLVVSADVPLIEPTTLVGLHRESGAAATVLSAELADPTGYGRLIRDASGALERIVEHNDATDAEASVAEINAGVYVFAAAALRETLPLVGTANTQGGSTSPTSSGCCAPSAARCARSPPPTPTPRSASTIACSLPKQGACSTRAPCVAGNSRASRCRIPRRPGST
jgi:bifunctional UDP-N-acetylglucosamine pyrophosphorylase / glucosamine-1-phosphate N-acetyltransferase